MVAVLQCQTTTLVRSKVTREYAGRSQRRQGGGRGGWRQAGVTRTRSAEMRLTDGSRAIGAAQRLATGAQDLSRPEGWSCRCCVTRGRARRCDGWYCQILCAEEGRARPGRRGVDTGWCDATATTATVQLLSGQWYLAMHTHIQTRSVCTAAVESSNSSEREVRSRPGSER